MFKIKKQTNCKSTKKHWSKLQYHDDVEGHDGLAEQQSLSFHKRLEQTAAKPKRQRFEHIEGKQHVLTYSLKSRDTTDI